MLQEADATTPSCRLNHMLPRQGSHLALVDKVLVEGGQAPSSDAHFAVDGQVAEAHMRLGQVHPRPAAGLTGL